MTSSPITIKQLNNLGERLRKGQPNAKDLEELDAFRHSFGLVYEHVIDELEKRGFRPSGRRTKTTESIIAKLKRERTRLSTMQDIVGCRIEVDNVIEQDKAIVDIKGVFSNCKVSDRRIKPSHGYRAVHIIATVDGLDVEIQVRTSLQDRWAQLSEKISDSDSEIKYGGGSADVQELLLSTSSVVANLEDLEIRLHRLGQRDLNRWGREEFTKISGDMEATRLDLQRHMGEFIISLTKEMPE